MNKDNAKEFLPLVQALADGKTLQLRRHDDSWMDIIDTPFAAPPEEYRIKPEPRMMYAVYGTHHDCYEDVVYGYTKEKAQAQRWLSQAQGNSVWKNLRLVKFVESY